MMALRDAGGKLISQGEAAAWAEVGGRLGIDPVLAQEFSAEGLQQQGEAMLMAEVTAGADRLIALSPGVQAQIDNYEHIKHYNLAGIPPLTVDGIKNLVLSEAEDIGKEILNNILKELDIPASAQTLQALANMDFDKLWEAGMGYGKEMLADYAMEAMAQYGVESVATYAEQYVPLLGLGKITSEALEDGELTQGEGMMIASSAMTTGGSMLAAGSLSAGLGMMGGVLAIPAMGTMYLEGEIEAQKLPLLPGECPREETAR